jgi:hypothetical protein
MERSYRVTLRRKITLEVEIGGEDKGDVRAHLQQLREAGEMLNLFQLDGTVLTDAIAVKSIHRIKKGE